MHQHTTGLILGFHGCDRAVAEQLIGGKPFKRSSNAYDWLGEGIYFWEANPKRALDFAEELARSDRSAVENPAVVGAVLNLGRCLDMTTKAGLDSVASAFDELRQVAKEAGQELPSNHTDLLRRYLDCAVINHLWRSLDLAEGTTPFQSARGVFVEGEPIYETSGFHHKTHIQIAVRDPSCIQGVFRVSKEMLEA